MVLTKFPQLLPCFVFHVVLNVVQMRAFDALNELGHRIRQLKDDHANLVVKCQMGKRLEFLHIIAYFRNIRLHYFNVFRQVQTAKYYLNLRKVLTKNLRDMIGNQAFSHKTSLIFSDAGHMVSWKRTAKVCSFMFNPSSYSLLSFQSCD